MPVYCRHYAHKKIYRRMYRYSYGLSKTNKQAQDFRDGIFRFLISKVPSLINYRLFGGYINKYCCMPSMTYTKDLKVYSEQAEIALSYIKAVSLVEKYYVENKKPKYSIGCYDLYQLKQTEADKKALLDLEVRWSCSQLNEDNSLLLIKRR